MSFFENETLKYRMNHIRDSSGTKKHFKNIIKINSRLVTSKMIFLKYSKKKYI